MTILKRWLGPCFLVFLLLSLAPNICAETPPVVETYEQLLKAIRRTRVDSQTRIQDAARQEKVREAWETGHLIDEHVLLHKERADYGTQVIARLAGDLGTSKRELYYMLQFARTYPNMRPAAQLSWSHYEILLAVADPEKRKTLEERAVREHWTRAELRKAIRKEVGPAPGDNGPDKPDEDSGKLPVVTPGPLDTYQIIRLKDRLVVDLGFGIYRDLPKKWAGKFKEGAVVKLENGEVECARHSARGQVRNNPPPAL